MNKFSHKKIIRNLYKAKMITISPLEMWVKNKTGQIKKHIAINEVYEYTGMSNIKEIGNLTRPVWDYLTKRNGNNMHDYIVEKILDESLEKGYKTTLSKKWKVKIEEIDKNLEDLAKYVTEGIVDIIE